METLCKSLPFLIALAYTAYGVVVRPSVPEPARNRVDRRVRLSMSGLLCFHTWAVLPFTAHASGIPVAMTLSFLGDAALAGILPTIGSGPSRVVVGGSFFALAQVAYTCSFWGYGGIAGDPGIRVWALVFILLCGVGLTLWPFIKPPRGFGGVSRMLPFAAYALLLLAMSASAVSAALGAGGWWFVTALGSLSFVVSDALVGATEMGGKLKPHGDSDAVWLTYMWAQCLIVGGACLALWV